MSIASIALPRIFRIGGGASKQLPEVLASLGLSRPLIVTDGWLANSGRVAELTDGLAAAGIAARVFADTVPDPTVASIDAGVAFLLEGEHDCVVGFGGGSPLDSAKAIALLGQHGGAMADYKAPHVQDAPGLPVIAIPTTAGTGSEATRFTIITDEATDEKMLCPGLAYLPIAALVDYELTFTKPRRLTADTGIDSLTHAIEAYVSKRANPFSDGIALLAMRAIAPSIIASRDAGGDRLFEQFGRAGSRDEPADRRAFPCPARAVERDAAACGDRLVGARGAHPLCRLRAGDGGR